MSVALVSITVHTRVSTTKALTRVSARQDSLYMKMGDHAHFNVSLVDFKLYVALYVIKSRFLTFFTHVADK